MEPWDNTAVEIPTIRNASSPHAWRRALVWCVAVVGVLLTSVGWATSSPVGASPDEVHHVVYAWGVATGQTLPGRVQETWRDNGAALTNVIVPGDMLTALDRSCYAFRPETPACAIDPTREAGIHRLTSTSMTRYPPPYYLLTGLVMRAAMGTGGSGEEAIVLARVVSGVVCLLIVGMSSVLLCRRLTTPPALVVLALTLTPQFLFLSASVNPNGFEIACAFAQAACVVAAIHDVRYSSRVPPGLALALCASTLGLGLARPASIVWALACAALLLVPFGGRRALLGMTRRWRTALYASLGAGVAWFVYLNSLRQGGVTDHDLGQWEEYPLALRFLLVVLKFGDIVESGYSLLGWADTKMPRLFLVLWLVVGAASLARLSRSGPRAVMGQRWAFSYLGVCAAATAAQSLMAGFGWQGRYFMPCVAGFLVLLLPGMGAGGVDPATMRNTGVLVLGTTWCLGSGALGLNLGRYLYGYSDLYKLFEHLPVPTPVEAWEPVIPRFAPLYLGVVGGLLLLVLGLLLTLGTTRTARDTAHL